jgi:hypothetical protein
MAMAQAMALAAPDLVRIDWSSTTQGWLNGDRKYILERIARSRRGRLVEIEVFPEIRTPADAPAALASLATAIGDGIITIGQGTAAGSLLKSFLETYETAHRLDKSLIRSGRTTSLSSLRLMSHGSKAEGRRSLGT